MAQHIAIEGPIGVGKTTLVRSFENRPGTRILLDVSDNPFLDDFYRDRPSAAFRTQMYFLASRFEQQAEVNERLSRESLLICDYLFARDKIFAYLNLDDQEILVYDRLFAPLTRYVHMPELVVYLKAPREVLIERLRRRNIAYESKISEQYLDNLIEAYDHFFYHYKESALLIVDTSQIDFVENEEDLKALQRRITGGSVRGIQYYHPVRKRKN
jgi:deoxyguanosine kinase